MTYTTPPAADRERTELLAALATQRDFLRQTVSGLSDDQAAQRTTPSELCLAGIIKHVTAMWETWLDFIEHGAALRDATSPEAMEEHAMTFRVLPGETVYLLLERLDDVVRRSDKLVMEVPSLDQSYPLPAAPWFKPGARWSARTTLLHILAETAQHCGHADIIREALDGAKTMG
ncbi:MAG TPA: DinB family protein [Acidimicrobiales bacterium]|nr:DinB family protein [Acidimicrobiales bacterium]